MILGVREECRATRLSSVKCWTVNPAQLLGKNKASILSPQRSISKQMSQQEFRISGRTTMLSDSQESSYKPTKGSQSPSCVLCVCVCVVTASVCLPTPTPSSWIAKPPHEVHTGPRFLPRCLPSSGNSPPWRKGELLEPSPAQAAVPQPWTGDTQSLTQLHKTPWRRRCRASRLPSSAVTTPAHTH